MDFTKANFKVKKYHFWSIKSSGESIFPKMKIKILKQEDQDFLRKAAADFLLFSTMMQPCQAFSKTCNIFSKTCCVNTFSKISPECVFPKISRRRAFSKIHLILLTVSHRFLHAPGQQEMEEQPVFDAQFGAHPCGGNSKADAVGHSRDSTHKVFPFEIPVPFGIQKFGIPKEVDKGMVLHNNGKRMPTLFQGPCIQPFVGQQEFFSKSHAF